MLLLAFFFDMACRSESPEGQPGVDLGIALAAKLLRKARMQQDLFIAMPAL